MIASGRLLASIREGGIGLATGTPCSYLKPFYNAILRDSQFPFREAPNEGDAVALAAGSWLGGKAALVSFQNSGLGNAVNPLTSLCQPFAIPLLLVVTHRAQPGGPSDEVQHRLMGEITHPLLQLLRLREIPWQEEEGALLAGLRTELERMQEDRAPRYLVLPKHGIAGEAELREDASTPSSEPLDIYREAKEGTGGASSLQRRDVLKFLLSRRQSGDLLVATTGYSGRELFALEDHPAHFYMTGSMGCASALGLGIALAQPQRRIIVIDGDGALLMRLGNLALVGFHQPRNLVHVVLDNGVHESTGGQPTLSSRVNFPALARASGYTQVRTVPGDGSALSDTWDGLDGEGPVFLHIPIRTGAPKGLPRPTLPFAELAARFRETATS